jgi:hypothetical protein
MPNFVNEKGEQKEIDFQLISDGEGIEFPGMY